MTIEKLHIILTTRALIRTNGKKRAAARLLGVNYKTLIRWMKWYNL